MDVDLEGRAYPSRLTMHISTLLFCIGINEIPETRTINKHKQIQDEAQAPSHLSNRYGIYGMRSWPGHHVGRKPYRVCHHNSLFVNNKQETY